MDWTMQLLLILLLLLLSPLYLLLWLKDLYRNQSWVTQMHSLQPLPLAESILTALQHQERDGLELIDVLDQSTRGYHLIGGGTLYPLMRRLMRQGWLESRWEEAPAMQGSTRRIYFKLTALGAERLQDLQQMRVDLATWQSAET
jgi:DNA-binding PadR family transcriptional regulator